MQHIPGEVKVEVVTRKLKDRDKALRELKLHLTRAQEHMKRTTNTHRRDVNFEVGNWVCLKLQPHRQQFVVQQINQKLDPNYYGPFQIEEKIGAWHTD